MSDAIKKTIKNICVWQPDLHQRMRGCIPPPGYDTLARDHAGGLLMEETVLFYPLSSFYTLSFFKRTVRTKRTKLIFLPYIFQIPFLILPLYYFLPFSQIPHPMKAHRKL